MNGNIDNIWWIRQEADDIWHSEIDAMKCSLTKIATKDEWRLDNVTLRSWCTFAAPNIEAAKRIAERQIAWID